MRHFVCIGVLFFQFCVIAYSQEKPELTVADLKANTHHFDIVNNEFVGEGSVGLIDEVNNSQFVVLGEYHDSKQISKFTRALIPVFHDAGCRTFALEIGPISSVILSLLSEDPAKTISNLNEFNTTFLVSTSNRNFTPIPFFSNVEDAEFLIEARKRNWNLIGLDQEFSFGYIPLLQKMFENLTPEKRAELKLKYQKVIAQIDSFYKTRNKVGFDQYKAILDSKDVNEFLELATVEHPENQRIADAIRFTTETYYLGNEKIRKYYEMNSRRIDYMKQNLNAGLTKLDFDLSKDKMLLKMGAVHTGRGFSPLSRFEIGNTLSELAEYNGNKSLQIQFGSRFISSNGKEIDVLDNQKGFLYRFKALLQMGKKDKWTVIDLRPMRSKVFYSRKFKLDVVVQEIFKNHDLFIIPPIEKDPTPNYSIR